MDKISACELYYARVPLIKPYVLSFVTVEYIDVVLVRVCLKDGRCGVAEAVPLPGYTEDTLSSILDVLRPLMKNCIGLSTENAKSIIGQKTHENVIAFSAILTAMEIASDAIKIPGKMDLPLLAPISASSQFDEMLANSSQLIESGYRTIKLKIGRDVAVDCKTIQLLLDSLPGEIKLRIDANQGYDFTEAERFLAACKHPRNHIVELLEQPLSVDSWSEFTRLAKENNHIPLMLDESIISEDDLPKSSASGADLVKLKLCKHRGMSDLKSMSRRAKSLGMDVVLGNGVASDLGNVLEASFFQNSGLCVGAYEGNGFCKISEMILGNPPVVVKGQMQWKNESGARLDDLVRYQRMKKIE
jgi:o-succinylbenzoate synthase